MIKEIISNEEIAASAEVIRAAFQTVAVEFQLNEDNCPSHPSFTTSEKLLNMKKEDSFFFGSFHDNKQVGFVAVEKADDDLYYMERLAVLPQYRHQKFGGALVEFVFNHVRNINSRRISIGIIDESTKLKDWYCSLGFSETGIRKFPHLPFTVCFMEYKI
jgi:diamine N-acetyltransferase